MEDYRVSERGGLTMEVMKLLECIVCHSTILPPVVLCKGGHSVCTCCRANSNICPLCQEPFSRVKSRVAENFLDKSKIHCRYKVYGCREYMSGRLFAEHQVRCRYNNRPILCRKCDKEVDYTEFLEHMKNVEKINNHCATECSTGFEVEIEEITRRRAHAPGKRPFVWEPTWILAHGHHLFCFLEASKHHWWIWVGAYATPQVCDELTCSIIVWNKEKQAEMKYVGKVHPIRSTPQEVFNTGHCLIFLDSNLNNLICKGGIDVLVRIDHEYQPPKTLKGNEVKSPLTLFAGRNSPSYRGNRINRVLLRNIRTGNDNALGDVSEET